jgi:hypothetical protein
MYDLYKPVEIKGCGRGRCTDLNLDASTRGRRYRVMRFWKMDTCPVCARPYDFAAADQTLYLGDSFDEALTIFEDGVAALFDSKGPEQRPA